MKTLPAARLQVGRRIAVWCARLPNPERIVALTNGARSLASVRGAADHVRAISVEQFGTMALHDAAPLRGLGIATVLILTAVALATRAPPDA
jgi:hypothetical protein